MPPPTKPHPRIHQISVLEVTVCNVCYRRDSIANDETCVYAICTLGAIITALAVALALLDRALTIVRIEFDGTVIEEPVTNGMPACVVERAVSHGLALVGAHRQALQSQSHDNVPEHSSPEG